MNNPAANNDQAGFTGHIKDSATGLNYMQARYYDPLIGRFLSIDPVGFSPDMPFMFGRYTYVANDPVNGVDPTGMFKEDMSAPILLTEIKVEIKAYPLGQASPAGSIDNGQDTDGKYGHAYVQYTNTATGDTRITNAFPNGEGGAFPNGTDLVARDDVASDNIDSQRGGITFDSETISGSFSETTAQVGQLVNDVNAAKITYSGTSAFGENSNNYAGEAFNNLTGRSSTNDSGLALPGLSGELDEYID